MTHTASPNQFQGSSADDQAPFRTIIITIDPDGTAKPSLRPAAVLARAFDASIIAVGAPGIVEQQRVRLENQSGRRLDTRYLAANENVHDVVAEVAAGSPRPLTVMATHARGRIGYALAGSVAEDVLRTRACPVLLIGPNCDPFWQPGAGSVTVTLDGTDLSEQALPLAESWADHFDAALTLMHVQDRSPAMSAGGPRSLGSSVTSLGGEVGTTPRGADATGPLHGNQSSAETYLAGKANISSNRGTETDWTVRSGRRPSDMITDHLEANQADLLVMTTHGRAGFGRIAVGSTTMAVTHDAVCPILAFAPADYE